MEDNYLSVAQVNNYIKNIFESETLLQNICVYGEVSSYNISNGIAYFNIKDENNLLSCVLFGANRFDVPKMGDQLLVTGSVSFYAKGGRLSFNATKIAPYGKGLLYEKFLELKNKLEKQGYFDLKRKKPIPTRVTKIGVVTSLTGAVIQDIIDVSTRRNNAINIVVYPSKVQGVGAEVEIANGINFFSNYSDIQVIIVARGGGSIEDLQPFNTEIVANAVYNCKKPLVSAVGHETDFTIIDFVSDLRAPTPSAAAELVVNEKMADYRFIQNSVNALEKVLMSYVRQYDNKIVNSIEKATNILKLKANKYENKILNLTSEAHNFLNNKTVLYENKVTNLNNIINKLNPNNLLTSGFTKIESQGVIVKSVSNLKANQPFSFHLTDGKVESLVVSIKENKVK